MKKPEKYRKFIDCMVEVCNEGQGQIGARRILRGEWNANAREDFLEDLYAANVLLAKLNDSERVVLARLLSAEFRAGVFETLKYLEEFEVEPFVGGYEGSPFHDFVGRVDPEVSWSWPE